MSNIHRIRQGECCSSVAKQKGLRDAPAIYDLAENASLRGSRPNPNVLFQGDRLHVRDKEQKTETGATEQRHRFRLLGARTKLRLLIEEFDGTAVSGKRYRLDVDGEVHEGTTGSDGLVEHDILADASSGEITVWMDADDRLGVFWPLSLGHLDPPEEVSGVQGRLNNLGYQSGPTDGIEGPRTEAAVAAFRANESVSETGNIAAQTETKAKDVYGF